MAAARVVPWAAGMHFAASVVSSLFATALFWTAFVSCVDSPPEFEEPPTTRIVVQWDPLACGPPHRVVLELADSSGVPLSSSVPCAIGALSLEAPHYGVYAGRIYSWNVGEPIRSVTAMRFYVDEPVVRWHVATPP